MSRSSGAAAIAMEDNWRRRDPIQHHQHQQSTNTSSSLHSSSSTSASSRRFHGHGNHPPATTDSNGGGGNFGRSLGSHQNGVLGAKVNKSVGNGRNERSLALDKGRETEREMERAQWRRQAVAAAAGIGHSYPSNNNTFTSTSTSTNSFSRAQPGSPAKSRFTGAKDSFLAPATPLQPLHTGPELNRTSNPNGVDGATHAENWALTPANSLPSLPGTPSKPHQVDFWQQRSNAAPSDPSRGSLRNASPRPPVLSTSMNPAPAPAPRSSAVPPVRSSVDGALGGLSSSKNSSPKMANAPAFTSPTHPSLARVVATGSPKRSPLSLASASLFTRDATSPFVLHAPHARQAPLSPTSARKRSVSPATSPLLGSDLVAGQGSGASSITQALSNAASSNSPHGHPTMSRRGSNNSLASIQGGHSLAHSRRTSQVYSSAQSFISSGTNASRMIQSYGVYRPPHLRRDSVHALKPAVAHYDRIRTPSLRGQSRSRESSVSVASRAGSRPPSAVPFNHHNTIPEDGVTEIRPRLGSFGSFLNAEEEDQSEQEILEEEDYLGDEQEATRLEGSSECQSVITPRQADGPDASELEAKLKEAEERYGYRQDQDTYSEDVGSQSQVVRSETTDDVDLNFEDVMNPSITESYCASRRGSVLGEAVDIFEVGDRLGPGMEHDGYTIRIAETSQGFRDQPEDIGLSGSELEVVRKLGEGSYAVVYLVREVEASERSDRNRSTEEDDEGAFGLAEDSFSSSGNASVPVPSSKSGSKMGRASLGPGDETLIEEGDRTVAGGGADSEDVYSSTLKATETLSLRNTSSPSFSSRDWKEKPEPREFALKCLCKRDLSPEMLEVQRLEVS